MAAFELGRQVEARGPHLVALAGLLARRSPRSRNAGRRRSSGASARDRQGGTRPGRCACPGGHGSCSFGVSVLARRARSCASGDSTKRPSVSRSLRDGAGEELRELHQQRVAAPGIGAGQRRRLVRHFVGHATVLQSIGRCREFPVPLGQLIAASRPARATKITGENPALPSALLAASRTRGL